MKRKWTRLIFVHCLLPLFAGAFLYLLFRSDNLFSSFFQIAIHIPVRNSFLRSVLFTAPDFLWSYSLAVALYLFAYFNEMSFKKMAISILALLLLSECIQIFLPLYFTFDLFDMLAAVLAYILATFQMQKTAYEKER